MASFKGGTMKSKDIKKYYELIKEAEKEIQQKNHIKALDLFDKAIATRAGITTVYFYKAELLFTLNRDIEATRLITSLGQIEDNLAHTYMIASRYFFNKGKMQIADVLYQINRDLIYGKKTLNDMRANKEITKKHLTLCTNN